MRYKINQQLGEKIARERKKRKLTQEDLAYKIRVQTATIHSIVRRGVAKIFPRFSLQSSSRRPIVISP